MASKNRGRGRPPTGTKIEARVPVDVLAVLDHAARNGTRAELVRQILAAWAKEQRTAEEVG